MSTQTVNREALTKAASLVAPALSSQNYIPALTHILFRDNTLTAYNDISSLCVQCDNSLECLIPGALLIKALGALSGAQVKIDQNEGEIIVSSGRSKIKMPTMPIDGWPLKMPDVQGATVIDLHPQMIEGIARCLVSVGSNVNHPAQMGVTLDTEDGNAVLFSTDNVSLSRYSTSCKLQLPADVPVILPRFFCEQIVALKKAFLSAKAELLIHSGALEVNFQGMAHAFTKTPVDMEPVDFKRMFNRHCSTKAIESLCEIPDSFDRAFERAAMVLANEQSKMTDVSCDKDSIRLMSACPMGEADDVMPYDGPHFDAFAIDPSLVMRVSKSCNNMSLVGDALILCDSDLVFTHMIAHTAKK